MMMMAVPDLWPRRRAAGRSGAAAVDGLEQGRGGGRGEQQGEPDVLHVAWGQRVNVCVSFSLLCVRGSARQRERE